MKKNIFLLMDMLFEGGRMFVGGVSVAFLLSRGVVASEVALIKALQAFVVFLAEVPTGVLGDRYGHKYSLLAAVASSLLGFMLYLVGESLWVFFVGEMFLALALCFWSGSYEAWASTATKIDQCPDRTKNFFYLNSTINQTGVLIFGFLGGFISGANSYGLAYVGAMLIMGTLFVLIVATPQVSSHQEPARQERFGSYQILKKSFKATLESPRIKEILIISVVLQFLAQPILHYWQPLFLSLNSSLGGEGLGMIFALYSGAIALASLVAKKFKLLASSYMLLAWVVIYILMNKLEEFSSILMMFVFSQVIYSILKIRYGSELIHQAPSHLRASVLSINSFVSRIGMMASLLSLSFAMNELSPTYQELMTGVGWVALGVWLVVRLKASSRLLILRSKFVKASSAAES